MSPRLDLVTVKEAARQAGVHEDTIYRMIDSGDLTAYRVGIGRGRLRVPRIELLRHFGRPTLLAEWGNTDEQDVQEVIVYWHHVCKTDDPAVVVRWMAECALKFWADHPDLSRQPGLYRRNGATAWT